MALSIIGGMGYPHNTSKVGHAVQSKTFDHTTTYNNQPSKAALHGGDLANTSAGIIMEGNPSAGIKAKG